LCLVEISPYLSAQKGKEKSQQDTNRKNVAYKNSGDLFDTFFDDFIGCSYPALIREKLLFKRARR